MNNEFSKRNGNLIAGSESMISDKMMPPKQQRLAWLFQQKRIKLSNGDLLVPLGSGMYDLFSSQGFNSSTRIKITKTGVILTLIGTPPNGEFKRLILAEVMAHGTTKH